MPMGTYDTVAPYYDFLSRMVYGDAITKASAFLVSFIPPGSTVAIIGGGTGTILQQIACINPAGLKIFYIDVSAKMISRAKGKWVGENEIVFINSAVQNVTLSETVDIVITPFLFDNFTDSTAQEIFGKIDGFLKPNGTWLFADFRDNGRWQKGLLKVMYLFFQSVCGIEAKRLPDTDSLFCAAGYSTQQQRYFFSRFIYSAVYHRSFTV